MRFQSQTNLMAMLVTLTLAPACYSSYPSTVIHDASVTDTIVDAEAEIPADVPRDLSVDPTVDPRDVSPDPGLEIETSHWFLRLGDSSDERITNIASMPDGSLVAAGVRGPGETEPDLWIFHIDAMGRVLGQQIVYGVADWWSSEVLPLSDGGLMISGAMSTSGVGGKDIWLARLSPSGSMMWQRTIGGPGDEYNPGLVETSDGDFILVATTESFSSTPDLWIVRLNPDATIEWQFSIGGDQEDNSGSGHQVALGPDGRVYVLAHVGWPVSGYKGWILSVDSVDGHVQWQQLLDTSWHGVAGILVEDSGSVVVGQYSEPGGGCLSWVARMSLLGDLVWHRAYRVGHCGAARGVVPRGDGGYLVSGNADRVPTHEYIIEHWLASIDPDGTDIWHRSVGERGLFDTSRGLIRHHDGVVITGLQEPPSGPSPADATVIRLGLDGTMSDCDLMNDLTVEAVEIPFVIIDTHETPRTTTGVVLDADAVLSEVDVPSVLVCP